MDLGRKINYVSLSALKRPQKEDAAICVLLHYLLEEKQILDTVH